MPQLELKGNSPLLRNTLPMWTRLKRRGGTWTYLRRRRQSRTGGVVAEGRRPATRHGAPRASWSRSTSGIRAASGTLPCRPRSASCRCTASTSPTRTLLSRTRARTCSRAHHGQEAFAHRSSRLVWPHFIPTELNNGPSCTLSSSLASDVMRWDDRIWVMWTSLEVYRRQALLRRPVFNDGGLLRHPAKNHILLVHILWQVT